MSNDERLARWWQGLTPSQRRTATKAAASGQLDEELRQTLDREGLIDSSQQADSRTLPRNVQDFLKMRHD